MRNFFKLLMQAIRGEEQNYTELNINRAIFLLSVPMILEMVGESLFAIVDAFFVARYVGVEGVATVGLTESVLTLIYSVAIGLSTAATAVVARRVGEGNKKEAGLAMAQVIIISLIFGIIVGILGFVFAEDILRLMGGDQHLIDNGANFTRIIFASSPSIILLYTLSGALRGAGDASTAMRSIILANFINIGMDFLLIPVMGMGVEGAAIATTIGRTIGVIYQLYAILRGNGNMQIEKSQFAPNGEVIKSLVNIGAGGTGQFLIQSASWIFLTRILSSFGSDVVAGYTIAIRIIVFTILPSWGLSNAASTLVGQNLGAGKPERAEASVWRVGLYNMGFLLLVGIIFSVFAKDFISIFNDNPKVVDVGVVCLQIICLGYVFFGYGMVIGQSLNGAGDTRTPTIMNLICFWALEIPLAYLFANVFNWGPSGVFWSIAISESILAVMAIFVFRMGRWKTKQV
ncbi:MATE family efflux transporter [Emticicia agri]|uniref:Multidrug-efflux transporter n=1 Tax=Emticicia agri TaxID=2492393 RepID=A0A4Q5LYA0_9BACT|nr:MATE family efflux transporter [Emticicia agri]RYU94752.1 MATE family efflux transporter [Emticicia agri]